VTELFTAETPAKRAGWLIAPFALWIGMMLALPATAFWYAVRSVLCALLLCGSLRALRLRLRLPSLSALAAGTAVGLIVLLIWIAPETWFGVGRPVAAGDSPYAPQTCGWTLTVLKLLGSAFVISVAEELFFRRWLVAHAGFWWMVALFALNHGERWAVGAVTGVLYGLLARRFGLTSAIIAHAVTNLTLGLWVILRGQWQFW